MKANEQSRNVKVSDSLIPNKQSAEVAAWPVKKLKDMAGNKAERIHLMVISGAATMYIKPTREEAQALIGLLSWALDPEAAS